jgi:DNA-binding NtrC family response regulator
LNAPQSQAEKGSSRATVLLVEDDIVIRSPLAEYLRAAGYMIVEAANAEEAIALFAARVPIAVVFSDIRMPGTMDGIGLARWIRRHQPSVRVMLTSGAGNAVRLGKIAEFFVPKPYQAAEVAARIGKLLETTSPTSSETWVSTSSDLPMAGASPARQRSRRSRFPTGRSRPSNESREPAPERHQESSDDDVDPSQR